MIRLFLVGLTLLVGCAARIHTESESSPCAPPKYSRSYYCGGVTELKDKGFKQISLSANPPCGEEGLDLIMLEDEFPIRWQMWPRKLYRVTIEEIDP